MEQTSPFRYSAIRNKDARGGQGISNTSPTRNTTVLTASTAYQPPVYQSQVYESRARLDDSNAINNTLVLEKSLREAQLRTQERYESQIQMLENDKLSLIKRLNMVLVELDRITQEKTELNNKTMDHMKQIEDIERKIEQSTNLKNVMQKNLQEDLKYERDLNEKLRDEAKRYENEKNRLLNQMREQEQITQDINSETQSLTYDLQQKEDELGRLEKEHMDTIERIKDLNDEIELTRAQEMASKHEKNGLQQDLESLHDEKNDLIFRMNDLTSRYEAYVGTMTKDQDEISKSNKRQIKILTAKILYTFLDLKLEKNLKNGLEKIKDFAELDIHTQNKTQKLMAIFKNYYNDTLKHAMHRWYRNALDYPKEQARKEQLIDIKVRNQRRAVFFYKWREAYYKVIRKYDSKIESMKIWKTLGDSLNMKNQRRAFNLWKDKQDFHKCKENMIKQLALRKHFRLTNMGMRRWSQYVMHLRERIRLEILIREVTNMKIMQKAFAALREVKDRSKHKRHLFTQRVWKGWKDFIKHKNFLKKATLATLKYGRANDTQLLRKVFDALQLNKNQEVLDKANHELHEVEKPRRQELENIIKEKEEQKLTKAKYNALRAISKRMSNKLYSYFYQWKLMNGHCKLQLHKMKTILAETYKYKIASSFDHWKRMKDYRDIQRVYQIQDQINGDNSMKNNDLIAKNKVNNQNEVQVGKKQNKKFDVQLDNLRLRILKIRFNHWKVKVDTENVLSSAALFMSQKRKKRYLRKAFALYKKKVADCRREDQIKEMIKYRLNTQDERRAKLVFDTWQHYSKKIAFAKRCIHRAHLRVDQKIKHRAVRTWAEFLHTDRHNDLKRLADGVKLENKELKRDIDNLDADLVSKEKEGDELLKKFTKQSRMLLSNTMVRMLNGSLARAFAKWSETIEKEKRDLYILRKLIMHWKRFHEYRAIRIWTAAVHSERLAEELDKTVQLERENEALKQKMDFDATNYENDMERLENQVKDTREKGEDQALKYERAIDALTDRAGRFEFVSKKRSIWDQWRDFVNRERQSCESITKVAQKYQFMEAMMQLHRFSREADTEAHRYSKLNRFFTKIKKRIQGNAMSKWKGSMLFTMLNAIDAEKAEHDDLLNRTLAEALGVKDQTKRMASSRLLGRKMKSLFSNWKNITKMLKAFRIKTIRAKENIEFIKQKYAINKWRDRKDATLKLNADYGRIVSGFQQNCMRRYLEYWVYIHENEKDFCDKLGKYAKKMDHEGLQLAFNTIKHWVQSKNEIEEFKKEKSAESIRFALERIYNNRLNSAFKNLRYRTFKKEEINKLKKGIFVRALQRKMKYGFDKWRRNTEHAVLAEEVNYEGETALKNKELKSEINTLKKFLVSEGYPEDKVDDFVEQKLANQESKMKRVIVNLKLYKSDKNVIPIAFDHWRRWLKLRKLFKHHLAYTESMIKHGDLHWAYNKWKQYQEKSRAPLAQLSKQDLIKRCYDQEHDVRVMDRKVNDVKDSIRDLKAQRQVLVDNYAKGQKLALKLTDQHYKKSIEHAWRRWIRNKNQMKMREYENEIKRQYQLMAELRVRMKEMELENRKVAFENEELRIVTLDSVEIATAVHELSKEREQLSLDLADRSVTITKLLEDNQYLNERLQIAQKEAKKLVEIAAESENQNEYDEEPHRESRAVKFNL